MSEDSISDYFSIKYRNKKCFRSKKNPRQETKCLIKTNANEIYELNLNKNKNWKTKKNLEQKIAIDPEYGKIMKKAKKLEIEIYNYGDHESKQICTFSNQKVNQRKKNKNQFKKEPINKNLNEKKISSNQVKRKKKEKHLNDYDSDYSVVNEKSLVESELANRTLINLKSLLSCVDQSNNVINEVFEGPIKSEKSPIINLAQEMSKNFSLIKSKFECLICCQLSDINLQLTECQHGCCIECWRNHILSKFYSFDIKCCFSNCENKISLSLLEYVLPKQKYEIYMLNFTNEILRQNFLKCPKCSENYIMIKSQSKYTRCICGFSICVKCKQQSHFPISCEQYSFYLKNFGNDKKDLIVLDEVKKCQKCYSIISKNGGCDHMRCFCKFNFNWSSIKTYRLFYNHKLNCLILDTYSIDKIDPFISGEIGVFRRFFLLELAPKLKNKENYLKKILINPDFNSFKVTIKNISALNQNMVLKFICHLIDFSFDFITKICRIVEMIYARKLIEIYEKLDDHGLLAIVRRLNRACIFFDKVISQKFNLQNLNYIIFIIKKIFKLLKKIN